MLATNSNDLVKFTTEDLARKYMFVDLIWEGADKPQRRFGVYQRGNGLCYEIVEVVFGDKKLSATMLRMIEWYKNYFIVFNMDKKGGRLMNVSEIICKPIENQESIQKAV